MTCLTFDEWHERSCILLFLRGGQEGAPLRTVNGHPVVAAGIHDDKQVIALVRMENGGGAIAYGIRIENGEPVAPELSRYREWEEAASDFFGVADVSVVFEEGSE